MEDDGEEGDVPARAPAFLHLYECVGTCADRRSLKPAREVLRSGGQGEGGAGTREPGEGGESERGRERERGQRQERQTTA
jgi:hypothetical protein